MGEPVCLFLINKFNCMKIVWLFLLIVNTTLLLRAQPDEMFRGNPLHNRNYNGEDSTIFNKIAWSFKTGSAIRSSAIAVNNNVYVGSNDGLIYALNKATGILQWKYN